jgi:hypothetical protein
LDSSVEGDHWRLRHFVEEVCGFDLELDAWTVFLEGKFGVGYHLLLLIRKSLHI